MTFTVDRNRDVDTLADAGEGGHAEQAEKPIEQPPEEPAPVAPGTDYILNTNSKKFHYPNCHSAKRMKESNKQYYTGTRDEIIAMGYSPCGNCNP